ncbi:MAG TPA: PucR family transcriptional regulator [Plantibacter sp.]|uniref:PucR family transcriptional regulator n=1 Tax=unclassified Plantibacter TaxID=2624265 RepID=UPI002B8BE6D5|nr:PucR family transcriptional regulator [Plantibacter sp.]
MSESPSTGQPVLPTVRDVLGLPIVVQGDPVVVAGASFLDRELRWVHVADSLSVRTGLDGGELLLTTGTAWPDEDEALLGYLAQLLDAGIVGMIVELGDRLPRVPESVTTLFEVAGVPLIALRRQTPFVRVTAIVHQRIIADQHDALRARAEVHSLFTGLSLRGSPLQYIVEEIARELRTVVVLEDREHRVIEFAGDDGSVLADWQARSLLLERDADWRGGPTGVVQDEGGQWLITPVEARGRRFGRLIALPGPAHPAGRSTVVEQAAVALALHRLSGSDDERWTLQSHRRILDAFLTGRFRSTWTFAQQLEASGFPVRDRTLFGIVVRVDEHDGLHDVVSAVVDAVRRTGGAVLAADDTVADSGRGASVAAVTALVSVTRHPGVTDEWIERLASALDAELRAEHRGVHLVIGQPATTVDGLLESLSGVRSSTPSLPGRRAGRVQVSQPTRRPFEHLWDRLQADPRVQSFVQETIGPVIEHDQRTDGDLLDVLWAYLSHPGNRSRAAHAASMSRSVFYQRIAQIEELLTVDLSDGGTVAGLHAAVSAHLARQPRR